MTWSAGFILGIIATLVVELVLVAAGVIRVVG
jgi:hypothetical protein